MKFDIARYINATISKIIYTTFWFRYENLLITLAYFALEINSQGSGTLCNYTIWLRKKGNEWVVYQINCTVIWRSSEGAGEIVEAAVLERLQRHPPLVGQNGLPGRLYQHHIITECLPHTERSKSYLKANIVDEHRRFCGTTLLASTCTFTNQITSHHITSSTWLSIISFLPFCTCCFIFFL